METSENGAEIHKTASDPQIQMSTNNNGMNAVIPQKTSKNKKKSKKKKEKIPPERDDEKASENDENDNTSPVLPAIITGPVANPEPIITPVENKNRSSNGSSSISGFSEGVGDQKLQGDSRKSG